MKQPASTTQTSLLSKVGCVLSLALTLVAPLLGYYYFVESPNSTISNLTPYSTGTLIIDLQFLVSPLLLFLFFFGFRSVFNLMWVALIDFGVYWTDWLVGSLYVLGSRTPPSVWIWGYFIPMPLALILGFALARRYNCKLNKMTPP